MWGNEGSVTVDVSRDKFSSGDPIIVVVPDPMHQDAVREYEVSQETVAVVGQASNTWHSTISNQLPVGINRVSPGCCECNGATPRSRLV
jgi:hypothetical protein